MRGNAPAVKPLHHYSTAEQVVGTWIDGKPLYEKVFESVSLSPEGVVLLDENIEFAFVVAMAGTVDDTIYESPMYISQWGASGNVTTALEVQAGNMTLLSTSKSASKWTVVVRYTKTTD